VYEIYARHFVINAIRNTIACPIKKQTKRFCFLCVYTFN